MFSPLKYFPANIRKFAKTNPIAFRYFMDGLLAASAITIASTNYNLFAVRLGANDFQLSLVQFLPQFFTFIVLIPGGFLIDSVRNKKRTVIIMMAAIMLGYLLCGLSPFASSYSVQFFLGTLSLTGCAVALYNIAWQSFFPDVVSTVTRNRVLTLRTRVTLIISMIAPLLAGVILTGIESIKGKIIAHQIFFVLSITLFVLASYNFRKFRSRNKTAPQVITENTSSKQIKFFEINNALKYLLQNKPFLRFTATALFFYMTWHFDWTLYFIGQVNYLRMNELQIGLVGLGAAAIQLLTLRFWSRKNEQYGVALPFTFGILGLSLCPVLMIVSVSLPLSLGPHLFIILHTLAHIPFAVVTLNMFQCLLLAAGDLYRSFALSVFACLVCLSNALMPVAGVLLYHLLGDDLNGFRFTFAIIFALRIIAALFWLLWWRKTTPREIALQS